MPKEKKFVFSMFSFMSWKISFSSQIYPSVMITTLRAVSWFIGMERAWVRAGSISVPPVPSRLSIRLTALCMFSAVAGREVGDNW